MSMFWEGLKVTLRVRQPDELAEVREPNGHMVEGYVWVPAPDKVFDLSGHVLDVRFRPLDCGENSR